jgi:Tfp pilus assembly protein PilO
MSIKSITTFLIPTIILSAISYITISIDIKNILNEELEKNSTIKNELNTKIDSIKKLDIDTITDNVYTHKKDIIEIKKDIDSIHDFKNKLASSFDKANFDAKEWQEVLNKVLDYSKIHRVSLEKVKNFTLSESRIKKQTINMQVVGNGKYKDIINFIKDIESISSMLKVKNIEIKKGKELKFYISLEGWKYKIKGNS